MKPKNLISSLNNSHVKNITLLQKKPKAREEQGLFVIEGPKMFEEARELGLLRGAYVSETYYYEKLKEDPVFFDALVYEVFTDAVFKEVSETKTPQGILGLVRRPVYPIDDILNTPNPFLLLLEDIRDPGNLGTMIRTAEGAGITGVIFGDSTVDIYNPKVVRATMGSIFRVPFYQAGDFYETIDLIKQKGVTVYAAHLSGEIYDTEDCYRKSCAFIIGNEANGLSERATEKADRLIRIPMAGKVESLNAAVAAAILMYEAARQRRR